MVGGASVLYPASVAALKNSDRLASLLLVGVVSVDGAFDRGDVILVKDIHGEMVAYGRSHYDHKTILDIMGEIDHKPLIHYNYLYQVN